LRSLKARHNRRSSFKNHKPAVTFVSAFLHYVLVTTWSTVDYASVASHNQL